MKTSFTYVKLYSSILTRTINTGNYFRALIIAIPVTFFSLFSSQVTAQCIAPSMSFNTPVLISGTDGLPGAVYRFNNVYPGIDATIQILSLNGGALLGEIDNTTQGYYDAWQPYVTAGALDTSYLEWLITFKKAGTSTDTVLPCLAITAVDVDGDNSALKEYIQAATPGAYAVDPATTLTISFDGTYNRAIGSVTTIPMIDTAHREAMFQMNFTNISSVIYRNGSISTKDTIDVRHTCIYFKPFFFDILVLLPVKIISFQASPLNTATGVSWTITDEYNLLHYTLQKSKDGVTWQDLQQVPALNVGNSTHTYYTTDPAPPEGQTYYRLKETGIDNSITYSHTIFTGNLTPGKIIVHCPTLIKKQLTVQLNSPVANSFTVRLQSLQGQLISRKTFDVQPGNNFILLDIPSTSATGLYIVSITDKLGFPVFTSKVLSR